MTRTDRSKHSVVATFFFSSFLYFSVSSNNSFQAIPSSAECFNYDDGDLYQVFQGPRPGSFYFDFQPQPQQQQQVQAQVQKRFSKMLSNYSSLDKFGFDKTPDFRQQQPLAPQRCLFYLFLSDLGDKVQVEFDNMPPWFRLVPLVGAEARDPISHCSGPGMRPIRTSTASYSIRVFTELVRPEINAYDLYQFVLCESDGAGSMQQQQQQFVFTSQDRIVAIQAIQLPDGSFVNNDRRFAASNNVPKSFEVRGRYKYFGNPAGPAPPPSSTTSSPDFAESVVVAIDGSDIMPTRMTTLRQSEIVATIPVIGSATKITSAAPTRRLRTSTTTTTATSSVKSRPRQTTTESVEIYGSLTTAIDPDLEFPDQDESVWFVPDCDRNITFATGIDKNANNVGIISSPGYPENYPMPGTVCKYSFSASGPQAANMRVQITFVDFDLKISSERGFNKQQSSNLQCDQMDHVRISFPAAPSNPLKFCGKTRPYAVMSPNSMLDLFFITEPASVGLSVSALPTDSPSRGYQFQYRFLREEREEQPALGTDVSEVPLTENAAAPGFGTATKESLSCEFKFRSTHSSNGSFSSVNHPGFYPRNSKCAYHFIGRVNERVMLIFGFFDVRSTSTNCSDGDYIQIEYPLSERSEAASSSRQKLLQSGANLVDSQRYGRYCSTRRPHGSIFSNFPHLLLTFQSDGRDDGRGFDAYYQFVQAEEAAIHQQQAGAQLATSNHGNKSFGQHSLLIVYALNQLLAIYALKLS